VEMADLCGALTKCVGGDNAAPAPGGSSVTAEGGPTSLSAPAPAAVPAPAAAPSLLTTPLDDAAPSVVLEVLKEAVANAKDPAAIVASASACKRLRVVCREADGRTACDSLGAASAVAAAMSVFMANPEFALQALAALVNLCSGDSSAARKAASEAGAMKLAVQVMSGHPKDVDLCEMACLVIQNVCYGDDENVLTRRQTAGDQGAIPAVLAVMRNHEAAPEMLDIGITSLRLIAEKMPALRSGAIELGAKPEWVRPIAKEAGSTGGGGGALGSFRGIFGTSRKKKAQPIQTFTSTPIQGGIQEE